jgi:1-aminocyclopropane-1-carboxylate deaminase/D-cysteine desulfhydrase-like pyridoxal-dependent ACC family enzyme
MFEFLLAEAKKTGADTIIGGAAVQSNYSRQLAAACNAAGLDANLVLRRVRGAGDDDIQGNLLLDLLAGATVHIIDASVKSQRDVIYSLADELRKTGKQPYVVRMANDEDLTPDVVAYFECFCEIVEQCAELGIKPNHIYLSSYDSTQAGLELAKNVLGVDMKITGITPALWGKGPAICIAKYYNQTAEKLGISSRVKSSNIENSTEYVGERYGIPTVQGIEMIKLMARTEGIFLDPVYTGKAMAGLYEHVQKKMLSGDDTVVFLHTGGTPALFVYQNELDLKELKNHLFYD